MPTEEPHFPLVYEWGWWAKAWATAGLVGLALALATAASNSLYRPEATAVVVVSSLVLLVLTAVGCFYGWRAITRRVAIWSDRLEVTTFGETQKVTPEEMRGFQLDRERRVFIVLKDRHTKIPVPWDFWAKRVHVPWFMALGNDTLATRRDIELAIASDPRYGASHFERQMSVAQAKRIIRAINITGAVVGLWNLIWPEPYALATAAMVAAVMFAAAAYIWAGGLIRFNLDESEKDPRPSLGFMAGGLLFLLFARTARLPDLGPPPDWFWLIVPAAFLFILFPWWRDPWVRRRWAEPLLIGVGCAIFLGVTLVLANVLLDNAPINRETATVVNKLEGGRREKDSVEVRLQDNKSHQTFHVSGEVFAALKTDDQVCLFRHRGWLNWPWVELRLCQ